MQGPWFDPRAYEGNKAKEKTVDAAAQLAYQESPMRQALVQVANLNKYLDGMNGIARLLPSLDTASQSLLMEILGKVVKFALTHPTTDLKQIFELISASGLAIAGLDSDHADLAVNTIMRLLRLDQKGLKA